ncbi:uncharacterized protein C9orf40 homolog [Colossoma macropomum]|uniref:uncharacterized protein C9orf40 homolog n=1 Tax=Colossoma macropomum TaxID=42526 RepID=UPI00186474EE|nr:uncharacterized protein C9orf40 homolog [Colossoma macropomum]
MCAGVCPFSPGLTESTRGTEVPLLARMTKRRAESASPFCSVPEKKRCRSVCSSADSPLSSAPPLLQYPASSDSSPRRRKRPSRPDPLESLPEPKKAPAVRQPSPQTAAEDCSRKFGDASGATGPAELQAKRPREEEDQLDTDTAEELTKAMHSDDDVSDDLLCAFNSFQFWRAPLPELDLSLLDPQVKGDATTKGSTEAMET